MVKVLMVTVMVARGEGVDGDGDGDGGRRWKVLMAGVDAGDDVGGRRERDKTCGVFLNGI